MQGVYWVRIKPCPGTLMSVNWLNQLFYQPGLAVPSLKALGQNGVVVPSCGMTVAQVWNVLKWNLLNRWVRNALLIHWWRNILWILIKYLLGDWKIKNKPEQNVPIKLKLPLWPFQHITFSFFISKLLLFLVFPSHWLYILLSHKEWN